MPNSLETFFDNTNNSLYIKLNENNSNFNLHIINELDNHEINNVILDLKEAGNDISIDFLIEKLKEYDKVITLVNSVIAPELLEKLQGVSNATINYDDLSFRDEKQKEDFEKDLTTNLLNLPLDYTERLTEFNSNKFNHEIAKNYVDLIVKDYYNYLDENAIERFKNTVIKIDGVEGADLIRTFLSSLIDLPFSSKLNVEDNTNIKEGLTDLVMMDFIKKHEIMLDYVPSFANIMLFLREKLALIGTKEDVLSLIFKGNIDQIITASNLEEDAFKEELTNASNHNSDYENLIHNIAVLSPENMVNLEKNMLKLSSRADSNLEALQIINDTIPYLLPEIGKDASDLINAYLNPEEISLSA